MDWKKTFNRGNLIIHIIFALALLVGIASTFYSLRLSNLQMNQEERDRKITSLVEKLKIDDAFSKMGKNLLKAQPEIANDKLRELSGILTDLEETLEINLSGKLAQSLRQFSKLINFNSEISNPVEVIKVLKQKVISLKDFSEKNKYKNIFLISNNLESKISRFSTNQINSGNLISSIKFDLDKIENLVAKSTLSPEEKSNISSRVGALNAEIQLLSNASVHLKDLSKYVKSGTLVLGEWILEVEAKIKNLKNTSRKKQSQLVLLVSSLVAFLLIGWLVVAYLFRWQNLKISQQIESEVKLVIEKGILSDQRYMMDHYSELMRDKIIQLLDELKIKLNLGTMLYEGLPFAGCLIDKEFKITWSNKLFSEQFNTNEVDWNNLKSLFKIDGDPVYEALVNKTSGIYSIKIRPDEEKVMKPYEMYVTPITVNREDRVMIFFYPLLSVKDAITDQVNVAKDTIHRFIELWSEDKLSIEQLKLLEKDFKASELDDLYKLLSNFYSKQDEDKKETVLVIESLEKENSNYDLVLDEIKKIEEERRDIIKNEFNISESVKESLINSFDKSDQLIQLNKNIMQLNDDLKNEAQKMNHVASEILNKNKETFDILQQVEVVKNDAKKLKFELLEIKTKLISLNTNLLGQLPVLDENQQKLVHRYKDELAKLDISVSTLEKKISQMDMYFGKLNHMYASGTNQQMTFNFLTTQKDHEIKETIFRIQRELVKDEESVIENFRELHRLMKDDLAKGNAIVHHIKIEELPQTFS